MADVDLNTDALDKLVKALKTNMSVKVGILGDKAARSSDGGLNNATIGAYHEFGTTQLPQRSFLRMPIIFFLDTRLQKAGLFSNDAVKEIIRTGSLKSTFQKIGIVAEQIVADAFDTGGFGQWPPSNMARKTNHQTLVETTQLRNSITSEVDENG